MDGLNPPTMGTVPKRFSRQTDLSLPKTDRQGIEYPQFQICDRLLCPFVPWKKSFPENFILLGWSDLKVVVGSGCR